MSNDNLMQIWGPLAQGGRTRVRAWQTARDTPLVRNQDLIAEEVSIVIRFTKSRQYEVVSIALIVFNAFIIAWETQQRSTIAARSSSQDDLQDEWYFVAFRDLFCLVFFIDLVLRMLARRSDFFLSVDWSWNLFDIVVVLTAILEAFMYHADSSYSVFRSIISNSSMLRILRLMRIVRVTRTVYMLNFFRELRIMVYSLCSAMRSLLWSMVMMMIIILVFGVFFTEASLSHCLDRGLMRDPSTEELRYYFGTLFSSMASLYMAISGGDDWGNVLKPLSSLPFFYKLVFYFYVTFAIFAMVNVVTAVFVDSTMQRSQNDREFVIHREVSAKQEFMDTMEELFRELDYNNSNQISLQELERVMNQPDVAAYFSALDLDVKQVRKLFNLIDLDKSGHIDREEFIFGCLRLKGAAKSLDIAILDNDIKWIRQNVIAIAGNVDTLFKSLDTTLGQSQQLTGCTQGEDSEVVQRPVHT